MNLPSAALLDHIASCAAEIDATAAIPSDLRRELVSAGLYRLAVAADFGGPATTLPEILETVSAVGRADGSVGWSVVHAVDTDAFTPALPRTACETIYAAGPDAVISGSGFDQGTASVTGDGLAISGVWRWVPDVDVADWFLLIVREPDDPGTAPNGRLRIVLVSPEVVEVVDAVGTVGLRGSRTGTVRLDGATVPWSWTAPVPFVPCVDDPLRRLPVAPLSPLWYSAVALGIAHGAIDDLCSDGWSGQVRSELLVMPAQRTLVERDIGALETELEAAWSAVRYVGDAVWGGRVPAGSPAERRVESVAIWAARTAVGITAAAFHLGGDLAAAQSSPLARRLRDVSTLGQHHRFRSARYAWVGAERLGSAA